MLVRGTWAEMKEVHSLDKEQAKRAGQLVNEIESHGEVCKALMELNRESMRGQYTCSIRERQDGSEVCRFVLTTDVLGTLILSEERIIASLENELEGL